MNIQDHNFSLNRGEQIKSIKVFTSFESQFIIGLQFKTTTNRDSQIFGQNSRFNYEIKSPYSSRYFVEYLHGKSKIFTFSGFVFAFRSGSGNRLVVVIGN